ncbi:MAG TPA: DUF4258 domain-containing protein [Chitinophagaceae bacterium]|nr:DUF4258 domain-containing protein [Chitinophagaceae bacterium]
MIKNWKIYRIIIFIVIITSFFISRTFLQKDKTPEIPPIAIGLDRTNNNLILTQHAKCRMECRDITKEEIKEILHLGGINYMKSNLNDKRGATYALEGYSHDHQHLRIIFAPKNDEMVVVTCIDLDKEYECNCN